MLLTSVTAQFPGATGLKFRNPSTNTVRGVRMQGEVRNKLFDFSQFYNWTLSDMFLPIQVLYPPTEEGWGVMTYICVRPQVKVSVGRMRIVTFTERSEWNVLFWHFLKAVPYLPTSARNSQRRAEVEKEDRERH